MAARRRAEAQQRRPPPAGVAEAAGGEPLAEILEGVQDFYNGSLGEPPEEEITRAAQEFYDYEQGVKRAIWSLDETALSKLQRRGAALARFLGNIKAADGLKEALADQSRVLAGFASKAKFLASSPESFISGLSEVFRSVEDVEEAARQAAIYGSAVEAPLTPEVESGGAAANAARAPAAEPRGEEEEEDPTAPFGLAVHDGAARRSASGNWVVPVQAWIYRRNEARHKIRMALCRKLLVEMCHGIQDIDAGARKRYEERGRLIFRTLAFRGGERNSMLEVLFDGEEAWRQLPPTGRDGRVKTELTVKAATAERASADGGPMGRRELGFTVRIPAAKAGGKDVVQRAAMLMTEPTGVLVVSDIDDTVKVTEVFRGRDMVVRNTFLEEFRPVSGMAQLFRSWALDFGAAFAFVSNSPPEFQEPLRDFLVDSGFPKAPVHLRPLGGTKEERRSFKQRKIEELLKQFPFKKVVLVGDSGERDPAVSAELLRRYPEQVVKVLIRQVHPDFSVHPSVFEGLPEEQWQVFVDPAQAWLPDSLRDRTVPSFLRRAGARGDLEVQGLPPVPVGG